MRGNTVSTMHIDLLKVIWVASPVMTCAWAATVHIRLLCKSLPSTGDAYLLAEATSGRRRTEFFFDSVG